MKLGEKSGGDGTVGGVTGRSASDVYRDRGVDTASSGANLG